MTAPAATSFFRRHCRAMTAMTRASIFSVMRGLEPAHPSKELFFLDGLPGQARQ
jgi:hypothetical protein